MNKRPIVVAALLCGTLLSAAAIADSPEIYASGKQCKAKWQSGPGSFRIWDLDLDDDDYCYVQWGFDKEMMDSRFSRPQDVGGSGSYPIGEAGCEAEIWWKVCKERQDDPDICSSVRPDAIN